jgi:hypothetical protein
MYYYYIGNKILYFQQKISVVEYVISSEITAQLR